MISESNPAEYAAWLRSSNFIALTSAPATDPAKALTDQVVTLMLPHTTRSRAVGAKGLTKFTTEAGAILGGVLRGAFKARPVSAQRRQHGTMWKDALIGNHAFWGKVDALDQAGLVGQCVGVQTNELAGDDPSFGGLPSRIWATPKLLELAASHGVLPDTQSDDWPVSRLAETRQFALADDSLIGLTTLAGERVNASRANVAPDQIAQLEQFREEVAALNACVSAADIRGCRVPLFRRSFTGGDLRLGGRYYAIGRDSYQSMSAGERAKILIGGESVASLDIQASYLAIFLALTGTTRLPDGDPYAVGKLPRKAVKAWVAQTFATGKPVTHWSNYHSGEALGVKPRVIREALFAAYPALSRPMAQILPANLRAMIPAEDHGWAVGQYLTYRESEAVSSVAAHLTALGTPALPMHDGLIVPASAARFAKGELERAFKVLIGVKPVVTL